MNLPFINPDTESKNEKNRGLTAFLEPLSHPFSVSSPFPRKKKNYQAPPLPSVPPLKNFEHATPSPEEYVEIFTFLKY